ncbi:MAG: hypothetical protein ACRDHN_12620 [Thermomicrobiales bacterium]
MSVPDTPRERIVERLTKAQENTGRQDLIVPPPTTEKSDPTSIDIERGRHIWVGFGSVGIIFFAVILYFLVFR